MTETCFTDTRAAGDSLHEPMLGGWIAPLDVSAFTRIVLGRSHMATAREDALSISIGLG